MELCNLLEYEIITDLDDLDAKTAIFCRPLQCEKELRIHLYVFLKFFKDTTKN